MEKAASQPTLPGPLFEVGRTVTRTYRFTRENIADYARMSGDTNPLHLDPEVAGNSRFGKIIACAAHSTGILISVLADGFSQNGESVGLGFTLTLRRAVPEGCDAELVWTVQSVDWSEKLRGFVAELSGELREKSTDQAMVMAQGRLLVLGDQETAPAHEKSVEGG
ncbi:MAG: MaoC family dehydratase [Filomicrobium sp.]